MNIIILTMWIYFFEEEYDKYVYIVQHNIMNTTNYSL